MSEPGIQLSKEELENICSAFRDFKHNLNNTLAVIMALSELSQRNPAHYEKLAKAILERGPEVVHQLNNFQLILGAKLKSLALNKSELG